MGSTDYNLHLGERLDIMRAEKSYVSSVQEITPSGTLCISVPTYRSIVMNLRMDDLIEIIYYRPQGMLVFTAGVLRVYEENGLQLAEVEMKSPVSKFQRREHVRLDIALAVRMALLAGPQDANAISDQDALNLAYDQTGTAKQQQDLPVEGVTADISGGGIRAYSPVPFPAGALLECTLWMRNGEAFRSQAKVIRSGSSDTDKLPYTLGLQFVNVNEMIRRKLIKYIFDEQVKIRKISGT